MVKPTLNPNVPPKTIMEEQKDYEKQEDDDDNESEEKQHSATLGSSTENE